MPFIKRESKQGTVDRHKVTLSYHLSVMTSTTVRARSRTGTGSAYQSRAQSRELVPVLKKSTHTTNHFMTSREQEIKSTIEQFRMQGGDEGYKGGIISTRSGNDTSTRGSFGQLEREREEARRIRARAMMEEAWRKDGRERRRLLLAEDESTGGSDFQINHDCPLRNYCAISDRVSSSFLLKGVFILELRILFLCFEVCTHITWYVFNYVSIIGSGTISVCVQTKD